MSFWHELVEDSHCGDAGGGSLSFDLVFSPICEMNSLQDLIWGAEKTEQLVFALDIGTTSSEFGELARASKTQRLTLGKGAVSFCHLIPGKKVEITTVHRWKGQEELYGDPKVSFVHAV